MGIALLFDGHCVFLRILEPPGVHRVSPRLLRGSKAMSPKPRQRRQKLHLEADTLRDNLCRDDLHPAWNSDEVQEDAAVSDYEREINRLDAAVRSER
jgi:hypothetical protein